MSEAWSSFKTMLLAPTFNYKDVMNLFVSLNSYISFRKQQDSETTNKTALMIKLNSRTYTSRQLTNTNLAIPHILTI